MNGRRDLHQKKSIMIIAGEASGDLHGAHLVRAMSHMEPALAFFGIGGENLAKAGVDIRVYNSQIAVVGGSEVFSKLKAIVHALRIARKDLRRRRPDLLILIDFPDFNLLVAATAKKLGIPVLYYISPQIWAWRTNRVKKIKKLIDHMMVIFPFEVDLYRRFDVPVTFVGHPLLDNAPYGRRKSAESSPAEESLVVGLLPGSRDEEIIRLLPAMVGAAETLTKAFRRIVFQIPVASTVNRDLVDSALKGKNASFSLVHDDLAGVLQNAALVITASGTVTLEAALAGTPMIIVYKVSRFSYWLGKRIIRVKYIGWPNLIAGKEIVPELIQDEVSAHRIAQEASAMLTDRNRLSAIKRELVVVADSLGKPGASRRAARIAVDLMT